MTRRPGRIDQIIPVELDRPRHRSNPEFLQLRGEILDLLHFAGGERMKSGNANVSVM
jgi:ABC-type nitrate/sulfonate/bicarbonate transport system ATPase subunit